MKDAKFHKNESMLEHRVVLSYVVNSHMTSRWPCVLVIVAGALEHDVRGK